MSRPFPWKCRSCGKQRLSPVTADYAAEMEHDGRAYSFIVPALDFLQCSACGERVLPDTAKERVLDQLRAEAGLLTPVEIHNKRKMLRLTQEQLAEHLQVAKETVSRWETGRQIQQRGYDTLLRLYFDLPTVRKHLERKTASEPEEYPVTTTDSKVAVLSFNPVKNRITPYLQAARGS